MRVTLYPNLLIKKHYKGIRETCKRATTGDSSEKKIQFIRYQFCLVTFNIYYIICCFFVDVTSNNNENVSKAIYELWFWKGIQLSSINFNLLRCWIQWVQIIPCIINLSICKPMFVAMTNECFFITSVMACRYGSWVRTKKSDKLQTIRSKSFNYNLNWEVSTQVSIKDNSISSKFWDIEIKNSKQ